MARIRLVLILLATSLSLGGPITAQIVEGVEAGRLRAEAKDRAAEAKAFADTVGQRGAQFRDDALALERGANANRLKTVPAATGKAAMAQKGAFDFDALVAASNGARDGTQAAGGPRFLAFASLSMPQASLKAMIADVNRAGGAIVFRGFPNNSMRDFGAALQRVVDKGQKVDGLGIDPRLFRAFHVEAVPTYVVTSSDIDLCQGFSCTSAVPPHDRMSGNVTPDYALSQMAAGNGPGAAAARVYLKRLRARGGQG